MNRYFIKMAYNGSGFHGWQIQDNAISVQAEINEKLSMLLGEDINVVGCGRTDTGVHASDFYAHFDIENTLGDTTNLVYKLNSFFSEGIVFYKIYPVEPDLHSRFSAKKRTYKYYISRVKDPFSNDISYYYNPPLDLDSMIKASKFLFDYTDFTSFSKLHTQTATNNCKIMEANWKEENDALVFTISADRFLRNMVRSIVGTLLEVGKGKLQAEDVKAIIEAKDRTKAGFSVPAKGLFLYKVDY